MIKYLGRYQSTSSVKMWSDSSLKLYRTNKITLEQVIIDMKIPYIIKIAIRRLQQVCIQLDTAFNDYLLFQSIYFPYSAIYKDNYNHFLYFDILNFHTELIYLINF